MHRRTLYGLTYLTAALSLPHHIDHLIRRNAVGWPLTSEVNAFTMILIIIRSGSPGCCCTRPAKLGPDSGRRAPAVEPLPRRRIGANSGPRCRLHPPTKTRTIRGSLLGVRPCVRKRLKSGHIAVTVAVHHAMIINAISKPWGLETRPTLCNHWARAKPA